MVAPQAVVCVYCFLMQKKGIGVAPFCFMVHSQQGAMQLNQTKTSKRSLTHTRWLFEMQFSIVLVCYILGTVSFFFALSMF